MLLPTPLRLAGLLLVLATTLHGETESPGYEAQTRLTIKRSLWQINGKPICAGSFAEGLLTNVRMVHAVFEDRNPKTAPEGFDPDANTARFVAKIPEYYGHGVRAFTLHLQGGDPGYEGALCSAFEPDGALREAYLARVAKVIEACDRAGMAVILGLFNRFQDQVLRDDAAVRRAVREAAGWLARRGYRNVIVEVAERYSGPGYEHAIFSDASGMAELVKLVREVDPSRLVSSCRQGTGRIDADVGNASDFLATHLTGLPPEQFVVRVPRIMVYGKPIVCTADLKAGAAGAAAADAASRTMCSWGFASPKNETYPFQFDGAADAPAVYAKLKELSRPE